MKADVKTTMESVQLFFQMYSAHNNGLNLTADQGATKDIVGHYWK